MKKVCLANIDVELLKKFLGIPLEFKNLEDFQEISCEETGNLFFIAETKEVLDKLDCDIEILKEDNKIVIREDKEYIISINNGYYYLLNFKSDGEIFRYLFKLGDAEGFFVFKKELNENEILHFLLSIFFIEKIL